MDEMELQSPSNDGEAPVDRQSFFAQQKIVAFEDLSGGQKVVLIHFNGQQYRLRLTKSGRLVLTK